MAYFCMRRTHDFELKMLGEKRGRHVELSFKLAGPWQSERGWISARSPKTPVKRVRVARKLVARLNLAPRP